MHTYLQLQLNLYIYTNPWPRTMDSAGKRSQRVNKWTRRTGRHCRPVLQLPTGQSCSLQTCCYNDVDPGAHGMKQGKANKMNWSKANLNGGKMLMRAVGMAGKEWQANKKPAKQGNCRRTQPADSPSGSGIKTNGHRWPASQRKQQLPQSWPASRRAVQVSGGVQWCWQPGRRVQTCLTVLPHLSPLPVTVPTHSLNL